MPNGNGHSVAADWFFKAILTIGTAGMCALTGKVWTMGMEQAASQERDRYIIQELQRHGQTLEQMRGDLNTLLQRKP